MPEISTFFKESDSSLGIFYPTHYIVMRFPSEQAARDAHQTLRQSGIAEDEALYLSAAEALSYFEEFRNEKGIIGNVMTNVSRTLGDDATFVDDDVKGARKGAGFVFVHSATGAESARIRKLVVQYQPLAMEWYLGSGIQSLV